MMLQCTSSSPRVMVMPRRCHQLVPTKAGPEAASPNNHSAWCTTLSRLRLRSSRGVCCAGENGPKLDQGLREALLQHLLTWEAGDAARQQSARTFILCRSFFEEVQASNEQTNRHTPPRAQAMP